MPDRQLTLGFDQLEKVISVNPNHKGLSVGVRFFERWMSMANVSINLHPPMVPAARHLARLHDFNVNPMDCLKVVGSVWLYSAMNGRFIKSDLHTRAVMGQKLFALAPMRGERKKTGKERKAAGKYIQDNIGVLLVSLTDAVGRMEQQEQDRLKAMGSRLNIT